MATADQKKLIETVLTRGVEHVYPTVDFVAAQLSSGKQLTVYLGIDPTGPSLHLGHLIQLMKLRQIQEAGHQVIMLIGSFTAMIGDPTDKSATRQPLTREQVMDNCKTYIEQASKVLDFKGKNPVVVKYNSDWLDPISLKDLVSIASHFTVQQLLERDMFEKRMAEGKPIGLHEFLYPLMQGYDSVAMDVDGEIGGNDQTYNMLAGRDLMKSMKHKEKFVITSRLLVDPTGKKMGKSEGNMVTLEDSPEDMFGKVMSWSDGMIIPGFELVTTVPMEEIAGYQAQLDSGANPRDIKMALGKAVVTMLHSAEAAMAAQANFEKVFSNKERPEEIADVVVTATTIVDVLVESKLAPSKGEAKRLVEQGGVKINDVVVTDMNAPVAKGDVIQKGKRFFIRVA